MSGGSPGFKPPVPVVLGSTALPPRVEGGRKGDVRLTLNNLAWDYRGAPERIAIRLKWWGEPGDGTTVTLGKGESAEATFSIASGPKYLARYLRDMSQLILYVADIEQTKLVGSVTLELGFFDLHSPIAGTFPIVGQTNRAFGRVDVRVAIHYDTRLIDSFEINEHLAAADKGLPMLPRMGGPRRARSSSDDGLADVGDEGAARKRQVVFVEPGALG